MFLQLRKKMICRMPRLTYMDRPVFEAERLAAEAWGRGGHEAEVEARKEFKEAQRRKDAEQQHAFKEWKALKVEEFKQKQAAAAGAVTPIISSSTSNGCGLGIAASSVVSPVDDAPHHSSIDTPEQTRELNISKVAHSFWSAEATREAEKNKGPSPNADGNYDVASFRAPSYEPDAIQLINDQHPPAQSSAPVAPVPPPPPPQHNPAQQREPVTISEGAVSSDASSAAPQEINTDFDQLD